MNDLNELRRKGALVLIYVNWLCVAVIGLCAFFAGTGFMPVAVAALITVVPTVQVARGGHDSHTRMAIGLALPLYPAILLWQWAGAHWMLDIHMIFFAAIAVLTIMADWRPILVAAGVTAVHHLTTNFAAPSIVFPNGSDFERVVFHAVVVVVETAVLIIIARNVETLVVEQAEAQEARQQIEAEAAQERNRTAEQQNMVIEKIGTALASLARGDLSLRLAEAFPTSYEKLRHHFNSAASDLESIVRNVTGSARQIENGSSEIRSSTEDLALRTEQQAATLEDIATTLSHLNTKVQANAASAQDLQGNVARARQDALSGSSVVETAVKAMGEIEQSADQISQIITMIDGIAFQTNLLALNAGVEAARAGEAGKGFAVVATEVRALAQRSADAANEIKALIETSTDQVSRGVKLVGESGDSLSTIVSGIAQIDETIETIARVSREQAEEIGRVNERISRLDSATQQNAAMVEEGTAAARHLSNEAENLGQIVAHFHLSDDRTESQKRGPASSSRRAA
ncbi:methyl-accepting chemotaxis protein [Novosphingobium malaysiense]|uniref:methyl-accepting chemotaxis protein n=1 Tax=Novosphingobium malaysiense TaxID=1348853 RepID=UPI00068CAED7|nr:methyl-accepting chemotaxis protein [Novosphingobium malaysiense]